jgi:hypothetical protein
MNRSTSSFQSQLITTKHKYSVSGSHRWWSTYRWPKDSHTWSIQRSNAHSWCFLKMRSFRNWWTTYKSLKVMRSGWVIFGKDWSNTASIYRKTVVGVSHSIMGRIRISGFICMRRPQCLTRRLSGLIKKISCPGIFNTNWTWQKLGPDNMPSQPISTSIQRNLMKFKNLFRHQNRLVSFWANKWRRRLKLWEFKIWKKNNKELQSNANHNNPDSPKTKRLKYLTSMSPSHSE